MNFDIIKARLAWSSNAGRGAFWFDVIPSDLSSIHLKGGSVLESEKTARVRKRKLPEFPITCELAVIGANKREDGSEVPSEMRADDARHLVMLCILSQENFADFRSIVLAGSLPDSFSVPLSLEMLQSGALDTGSSAGEIMWDYKAHPVIPIESFHFNFPLKR